MAVQKIQTGLRIDETTYGKLKYLAITDGRTLNNLVEHIIRQYLAEYERTHGEVPVHQDPEP